MSLKRILAAGFVFMFLGSVGFGQTALEKLESRIKGALGGKSAPAEVEAVPAAQAGYLGFFPDETVKGIKGVVVSYTKPGGPADRGGLQASDVITAVDGKAIQNLEEFDAMFAKTTVGQRLRMTVDRDGKLQSLTVTVGSRPAPPREEPGEAPTELPEPAPGKPAEDRPADATEDPLSPAPRPAPIRSKPLDLGAPPSELPADDPTAPARPAADPSAETPAAPAEEGLPSPAESGGRASLGITVVSLTDEARAQYGLTVRRGALITAVRPGSPADRAGLPIGSVVVAIDGRRIDTADDLVAAVRVSRPGQEVELSYYEGPRLSRKAVRLAPAASGIVPATPSAPADPTEDRPLGLVPGAADRPLLDRVEGIVDGLAGRRGPSTVYDPSEMAALRDQVLMLQEKLQALEERLKQVEGKLGGAAPADGARAGLGDGPVIAEE